MNVEAYFACLCLPALLAWPRGPAAREVLAMDAPPARPAFGARVRTVWGVGLSLTTSPGLRPCLASQLQP
jgi:hypothetical protein